MLGPLLAWATPVLGAVWLTLYAYQFACMAYVAHRLESSEKELSPEEALDLTLRFVLPSLLLVLLWWTAWAYLWRDGLPVAAPWRWLQAGRATLVLVGLWGLRWQHRRWLWILKLTERDLTVAVRALWLLAACGAGVFLYVRRPTDPAFAVAVATATRSSLQAVRDSWPAQAGIAALLAATALVLVLRYDERMRWFGDEPRWRFPGAVRLLAIAKLGAGIGLLSLLLATAAIFVWNRVAQARGEPPLPDLLPSYPPVYYQAALLWQAPIVLVLLVRCARRPLYDVFVSYKSEDVELVRGVANLLLAAGVRAWFAEYHVLLRRRLFEKALRRGLRESAWGLAFTNDRYVGSQWCRLELERLLRRLGPRRVLEVQIPREGMPRRRYPELASSAALESRDVTEIVQFVHARTGLSPAAPEAVADDHQSRYEGRYLGRPLSFDVTGWQLHEPPKQGEIGGLTFRYPGFSARVVDGQPQGPFLFVNLWAHPETSRPGQRLEQTVDDRQMFEFLVSFARGHLRRVPGRGVRLRGVHLLFHSNLSQVGMTYWNGRYWTRKVSLVIPNPTSRQTAELELTFGFLGPFAEYCRHVALMDRLALSLRWE